MYNIWRKKSVPAKDIAPDEIFLDASNLPRFDQDQFEGRIERPIRRSTMRIFTFSSFVVLLVLLVQAYRLQIVRGDEYRAQSENNRLDHVILFPERGVIYDRTGTPVVWNEAALLFETATATASTTPLRDTEPLRRAYATSSGMAHVLGFVSYPQKDAQGHYFQTETRGLDGVEKVYDELLAGEVGRTIVERDALGNLISSSAVDVPRDGDPLVLSIDARVQKTLADAIARLAADVGFVGGSSAIIDVHTGELLALVSMPEFDSGIMSLGEDTQTIGEYTNDSHTPFLNRAIGGLYTPGSVVKPFFALAALEEGVIDPEKEIYSDGALRVPNPYDPEHPTVFKDWKAHGWVDMRRAIAVSSNVYFMTIGGGFEDQRGLGIRSIERYARLFGIGEETGIDVPGEVSGVIPSEEWKKETFPGDPWRLGDTYNTSIGQYGFQTTALQMARATAALANGGFLPTPHVRMDSLSVSGETIALNSTNVNVIREGMRQAVLEGTAKALNVESVEIAAKTGTAELGSTKQKVNSWIIGFWPATEPRYAFATVMEKGPATNLIGSAFVMRQLFDWLSVYAPEYL